MNDIPPFDLMELLSDRLAMEVAAFCHYLSEEERTILWQLAEQEFMEVLRREMLDI